MKRDLDLCRQLLFDLESHGPDCPLGVLRNGWASATDARLRYHLRLLCDAGLVKELDSATGGAMRVRLTHAGLELIELCRSDARWREAKQVVLDRTGGLSLTVLRTVLTKWAVEAVAYGPAQRPRHTQYGYHRRPQPMLRSGASGCECQTADADSGVNLVRTGPDYRERLQWPSLPCDTGPTATDDTFEANVSVSLPIYLV